MMAPLARSPSPPAPRAPWLRLLTVAAFAACGGSPSGGPAPATPAPAPASAELRPPEAFASISDRDARSRALFLEATRVMLHPRCMNCHPSDDSPRQRDGELHDPPVTRGPDDTGVPAMQCATCHQDANVELARVPGAPGWKLAPKVMAWQGRTPAQICAQVQDPARNGGRSLAKIVEHSAHDALVAWGWAPGHGRAPAPGTQERFGALMAAWVESGAACPPAEQSTRGAGEVKR